MLYADYRLHQHEMLAISQVVGDSCNIFYAPTIFSNVGYGPRKSQWMSGLNYVCWTYLLLNQYINGSHHIDYIYAVHAVRHFLYRQCRQAHRSVVGRCRARHLSYPRRRFE